MMNIISNNCIGGHLYTSYIKNDFQNPFMWSSITIDNFCKLIKNYDILNFNNIKCELVKNEAKTVCEYGTIVPKITIDDCVDVYYCHYLYDQKYDTPKKIGGYKHYKHIDKYTVEEYFKRLKRMTEPPIFLWNLTDNIWYNPERLDIINEFRKLNSQHIIVVFSTNVENKRDGNIIFVKYALNNNDMHYSVPYLYENFFKDFIL